MTLAALPVNVALVSKSRRVPFSTLAPVAAALQQQVQRDFAPVWHVSAVVTPFETVEQAPPGYWPIVLADELDAEGALGYHTDRNNQPRSWVLVTREWPVTCSHELLEMLADPWGSRFWAARNPVDNVNMVRLLIEVADPCEAITYEIGGVKVSDFAFPAWYYTSPRAGARYSLTGALVSPRKILTGGYVSFVDQHGVWWQQTWWGSSPEVKRLGRIEEFALPGEMVREAIDRVTAHARGRT